MIFTSLDWNSCVLSKKTQVKMGMLNYRLWMNMDFRGLYIYANTLPNFNCLWSVFILPVSWLQTQRCECFRFINGSFSRENKTDLWQHICQTISDPSVPARWFHNLLNTCMYRSRKVDRLRVAIILIFFILDENMKKHTCLQIVVYEEWFEWKPQEWGDFSDVNGGDGNQ